MSKLRGKLTFDKGKPHYDGLVTQILGLGGFEVKIMVQDGNKDTAITQLLGGGVLGVPWELEYDRLIFNLKIRLHDKDKPGNLDDTPDLTVYVILLLKDMELTIGWCCLLSTGSMTHMVCLLLTLVGSRY